jgi:hypothetical protein
LCGLHLHGVHNGEIGDMETKADISSHGFVVSVRLAPQRVNCGEELSGAFACRPKRRAPGVPRRAWR